MTNVLEKTKIKDKISHLIDMKVHLFKELRLMCKNTFSASKITQVSPQLLRNISVIFTAREYSSCKK